jgi:hypothetical protein
MQVVSTSATGKVHVFAADGKAIATQDASVYAMLVRVGRLSKTDAADTIVIAGTKLGGGLSMAALDGKGHVKWTLKLPEGAEFANSMALCATRPWAACTARGGRIVVVDCSNGQLLATALDRARDVEVTWATPVGDEPPLLLVADGHSLTAYRVTAGKGPTKS